MTVEFANCLHLLAREYHINLVSVTELGVIQVDLSQIRNEHMID